jgi:hypothetical protein
MAKRWPLPREVRSGPPVRANEASGLPNDLRISQVQRSNSSQRGDSAKCAVARCESGRDDRSCWLQHKAKVAGRAASVQPTGTESARRIKPSRIVLELVFEFSFPQHFL